VREDEEREVKQQKDSEKYAYEEETKDDYRNNRGGRGRGNRGGRGSRGGYGSRKDDRPKTMGRG